MDFEKEKQGEGGYGSRQLSLSFLARFYMSVTRLWKQTELKLTNTIGKLSGGWYRLRLIAVNKTLGYPKRPQDIEIGCANFGTSLGYV